MGSGTGTRAEGGAPRKHAGPAVVTDARGIDNGYEDVRGEWHPVSEETRATIARAIDAAPGGPYYGVVIARDRRWTPDRPGDVQLEDGSTRAVDAHQEVTLPLGYHEFRPGGGEEARFRIIAAPARCYLPPQARAWGWAAQLYATRSLRSWGIGDLADLRQLAGWARPLGAELVMVNPLCAVTPVPPIEPSPYFPSSRRFRNPIYLRVEEIPGAQVLGDELERLARSARNLNQQRRIDRDVIFSLKLQALERIYAGPTGGGAAPTADLVRYRQEQGTALDTFACFCALAELHGKDWRRWPAELRHPNDPAVLDFARRHAERVSFHAWVQWQLDQQLRAASAEIGVVQDLPIGLDPGGADAWCWQDLMASGVSVGVPPDELNPAGQDWGLLPFVPRRLRAAGYQPFIETIRATARYAAGLRIDHVMGLFRLYWIPNGAGAAAGAFVRTRAEELMAIVALESERARAFVVGEDLGTVEKGVRESMADWAMLSYRLLTFEDAPPAELPEMALSTVTTHDLPTIAGLWTGADRARGQQAGVEQNEKGLQALRERLARCTDEDADTAQAIADTHAALAEAPSRILLATLDDALGVEERPNIPGAPPDWPNWSLALPVPLEDFAKRPLPAQIARALARG